MVTDTQTQIDWDDLLKNISKENVIPIIGNEVYKFKLNDTLTNVDTYLADTLLKKYDLQAPSTLTLLEAVAYLGREKNKSNRELNRIFSETVEAADFKFPVLEEFLGINDLLFYLNTTVYNSILENALKEVRNQPVTSIDFSIRSRFSDCENIDELKAPVVFNVFGSFQSTDPALSEEEMLEFTASFKERMIDNAKSILDDLKDKSLLFLGCTHPDWLMRFFLRVLSNERFNNWLSRPSQIIVVNDQSDYRQRHYAFLQNYNTVTYDGNTSEFIQELSDRWKTLNPGKLKNKMIFLSYTQKDKTAVENLKNALSTLKNVTCWYDKEELHSGDNFEKSIVQNIMKADLFIPLISQNSLTQENKYVTDEWFKADTINTMRELEGKTTKYLMPIVIDNSDLNHALVKKYYPQLSIEPVLNGMADEAFINRVKASLNV